MRCPPEVLPTGDLSAPAPTLHRRSVSTNSHFLWKPPSALRAFHGPDPSRQEHHHFQAAARPSDSWSWRSPAVSQLPIRGATAVKTQAGLLHPEAAANPHTFLPQPHVRTYSQRSAGHGVLGTSKARGGISIGKPSFGTSESTDSATSKGSLSGQRFDGVVHSLKHSYGFVRCDSTGDRIFFHFSEIDRDSLVDLPEVPADHPPVMIGDRVKFFRANDAPTGREKAVNVIVVSRDASASAKMPNGAPEPKSAARSFPIQAMATLPSPESPGEDSAEDAAANRGGLDLGSSSSSSSRETGVVVSAKHSYGFIKCAERDHKQVFFHFSEVVDNSSLIRPGTEIEFTIAHKGGKVVATRIRLLPPGSVVFATVNDYTITGVVRSGVQNNQSASQKTRRKARPSSMDVGSLTVPDEHISACAGLSPSKAHDRTLTFSGADMKFPGITLMEGDEVQFRVKTDRRTHARTATEVLLVKPSPAGRQRGIITIWKELYGFLKCDGRKDHLFVHLNEFVDKAHHPEVGDEVEFNVALDNRGQDNATRVMVLPKGTVTLRDDRIFGVVMSKPHSFHPPASRRTISEMSSNSAVSSTGGGSSLSYGTIRLVPVEDRNGEPQLLSDERFAELKPLPADHGLAAPISPIAEDSEVSSRSHSQNPSAANLASPPHHRGGQSWRGLSDAASLASLNAADADESPMNNVRFTLADRENGHLALRRGDLISLAVAPAPKFLRASNIRLVPKLAVVTELSASEAIVSISGLSCALPEMMVVLLSELDEEVGPLKVGDEVSVTEVGIPATPNGLRIARSVKRAEPQRLMDKLLELVPDLHESMTLHTAVSVVPSSQQDTPDGSPSSSHRRWDSRLEPRNWS